MIRTIMAVAIRDVGLRDRRLRSKRRKRSGIASVAGIHGGQLLLICWMVRVDPASENRIVPCQPGAVNQSRNLRVWGMPVGEMCWRMVVVLREEAGCRVCLGRDGPVLIAWDSFWR